MVMVAVMTCRVKNMVQETFTNITLGEVFVVVDKEPEEMQQVEDKEEAPDMRESEEMFGDGNRRGRGNVWNVVFRNNGGSGRGGGTSRRSWQRKRFW